ncbi:ubiquitin-related domain-containing protein [Sporodiniella umbellata]|nr:ubiquitin-related domain-containing protein [Sporodiniella umbellata]
MLVTVTTDGDELYNLEIDSQMAIEDFKALLEAESGVSPAAQKLTYQGKELSEPKKTLEEYQVGDNEIVHMQSVQQLGTSSK